MYMDTYDVIYTGEFNLLPAWSVDEVYGQQVTVWLGRKQHACMSTTRLAILPIGTVMILRRGLTATIIFISISCVHAVDRSVDSTS